MKELIKGIEEEMSQFTMDQVNRLQMVDGFHQNHLAKVLVGHIETLQAVIHNLLEERK